MNETLSAPAKNPSMASVAEIQVTKAETVTLPSDKLPYDEKTFDKISPLLPFNFQPKGSKGV